MRRYGRYKTLNMIFGILPFCAAILMTQMKETSNPAHLWMSIVCIAFFHTTFSYDLSFFRCPSALATPSSYKPCTVEFQYEEKFIRSWVLTGMACPVALVSHLPESQMAVGTGFAQLLRGLGIVFVFCV